jgi:hypothetical protein
MRDIANSPIFLRLGSRMRSPEGTPVGELRRVNITNFVVYNADPRFGSIISGIPGHDIEDVRLTNIRIYYKGGGTKQQAALSPPEEEKTYPEPRMFGEIPAYGFFIRHAKGIEFDNVQVNYINEDFRPPFILNSVAQAEFNNVKGQHASGVPTVVMKDVDGFKVHNSSFMPDTQLGAVKDKQF